LSAGLVVRPGHAATVATPALGTSQATPDENRFLALINQERRARGLGVLTQDPLLREVARRHSRDMAERGYFAHEAPTESLRTPMERYLAGLGRRPGYAVVGENLFYCSELGVQRGHRSLMESPGHRRNILDKRYEAAGVGVYVSPDGEYFVTQMFLKQRD
jgi:uncharacterized protein YkwD